MNHKKLKVSFDFDSRLDREDVQLIKDYTKVEPICHMNWGKQFGGHLE